MKKIKKQISEKDKLDVSKNNQLITLPQWSLKKPIVIKREYKYVVLKELGLQNSSQTIWIDYAFKNIDDSNLKKLNTLYLQTNNLLDFITKLRKENHFVYTRFVTEDIYKTIIRNIEINIPVYVINESLLSYLTQTNEEICLNSEETSTIIGKTEIISSNLANNFEEHIANIYSTPLINKANKTSQILGTIKFKTYLRQRLIGTKLFIIRKSQRKLNKKLILSQFKLPPATKFTIALKYVGTNNNAHKSINVDGGFFCLIAKHNKRKINIKPALITELTNLLEKTGDKDVDYDEYFNCWATRLLKESANSNDFVPKISNTHKRRML